MAQQVTHPQTDVATRRGNGEAVRSGVLYRPRTDIYETEDKVVLTIDLPGVASEDVDITLERQVLSIRGHVRPQDHDGYRQVYTEYRQGDFERVFTLSEEIDRERIHARQKDGVLTLELPKASGAKAKKIDVKGG